MNATSQQMAARRYRIERYLTEGGMGAIYVGKKLGPGGFEKDVVLKQLLPEHTARPEFRDLFFREAKISATLDHANIVHTFDLVESDESLFIVMEYVRGADLRTICRRAKLRRRQIAPAAGIQIALEILAGLSYAHTRRDPKGKSLDIIHRDVSPSNILCSAEGEVKLSDFGIAKASTHSSVFYRVRGKVGYMSPEQARNQPIDARTDLYSVAVCLYEALTSERLFVGDLSTPPDVIYGQPIAPPSYKRPGLPRALDHVMATALASDPDDRYQDARAFAEALRQVAHHHGLLSSAPQLAEDLRDILGNDPSRWLQEETDSFPAPETQKIQIKALEGKEASSIGVVERSDLYLLSGGDLVSPKSSSITPPPPSRPDGSKPNPPSDDDEFDFDALLRLAPKAHNPASDPLDESTPPPPQTKTQAQTQSKNRTKTHSKSQLTSGVDDPFPLAMDEDVPTSPSRPVTAAQLAHATAPPRVALPPPRVGPPPPPRSALPAPNGARAAPPPPPPRPAPPRAPAVVLESPFEEELLSADAEEVPIDEQDDGRAAVAAVGANAGAHPHAGAGVSVDIDEPVSADIDDDDRDLGGPDPAEVAAEEDVSVTPADFVSAPPRGAPYVPATHHGHAQLPAPHGPPLPQPHAPQLPQPSQSSQPYVPHPAFLPAPHNGFAPPPSPGPSGRFSPVRPVPAVAYTAPRMVARSGPPGLLVLVVLLAAAAGGAKLAILVSRQDVASLTSAPDVDRALPGNPAGPPGAAATTATAPPPTTP
jgi:serine/threonine protein kinase